MPQPDLPAHTDTPSHSVTRWDRAAIVALGSAGCALSYDALQQMATAIHVRGLLTYLFPLVVDGFIAYGVRALIILRGALFRARAYVWTLFGTATAASIWANALHAVRLNQQTRTGDLRLGDTTVGILSTLAPLALAGAVHLYILIARQTARTTPTTATSVHPTPGSPGTDLVQDQPGPPSATDATQAHRSGRPPGAEMDELLAIARTAVEAHGRVSRAVARDAIREAGLPISEDRLTELMQRLRADQGSLTGLPVG
ncbi:DUF2637 domain-containing protein [Streptomyces sp. NPDC047071]|uniref:DUF2637 domain-containing protein n=1 Tax=Streptomyces sp. NPDC047071 TaxID=3154808 RepID=UPI003452BE52